ncbi:MAG: hypothetical protein ACR2NA_13180 [Solirubrobacterales bacterium]
MSRVEHEPRPGTIGPELAEEFPRLGLRQLRIAARPRRSPPGVREVLRHLSSRISGAQVVHLRQRPIPAAYRVFFRHIGIDPDKQLPPAEQVAMQRLHDGHFRSRNVIADAVTIAVIETGVPVRVVDGARTQGELGLRLSRAGERLGGAHLATGTMVVADEAGPVSELFAEARRGHAIARKTREIVVYAVQVGGVPDIAVDEALWQVAELAGSSSDS